MGFYRFIIYLQIADRNHTVVVTAMTVFELIFRILCPLQDYSYDFPIYLVCVSILNTKLRIDLISTRKSDYDVFLLNLIYCIYICIDIYGS
ncbi:hypothetical protein JOC75_003603 [Metabacillus crassostreae]|nr:hypothetical protein [Metabacillus crassostreae]